METDLVSRFQNRLKCLILYGSWAQGTAGDSSDIDLLAILDHVTKDDTMIAREVAAKADVDRTVSILVAGSDEFLAERLPLFTAAKKKGIVVWGEIIMSLSPVPPAVKYAGFFEQSCEFESEKVTMASKFLEKDLISGIPDICFVAAKHAIQAALAMRGEGYSSKVAMLLPLAQRHFGSEVAACFRKLLDLHIRFTYGADEISEEDARLCVDCANKVLEVYRIQA